MPTQTINLNNSTPAAPSGCLNVEWQAGALSLDPAVVRNVSAYVPKFTGDTGAGGSMGLVPAPAAGDAAAGKVLKADGTWYVPPPTPLPTGAANEVVATPDGSAGVAALRTLVPSDLPVATTSALGAVKPDGSTILITAGVISAPGGGGGGMSNPMTTQGDLIVGGAAGAAARLAAGTSGQVLQTNGGSAAPSWVTPSGGGGSTPLFGVGNPFGSNTPVLIQHASGSGSISTSGAVVTGNLLIFSAASYGTGTLSISDNLGTSYTLISSLTEGGARISLFAGLAGASGVCTVTIVGASGPPVAQIAEFVFGTTTLDGTVQTITGSVSPTTALNLTTASPNDILITVYSDSVGGGGADPNTGWTKLAFSAAGGWADSGLAYQIGAAGAYSSTWTGASSANAVMLAAFKARGTPVSGSQGQLYFDTTNSVSYVGYVYNAGSWVLY
jgi:hypothetical protein